VYAGLGFAMVITNMTVALYYCVIISWALYYLFASMQSPLPWSSCGNWYNTKYCIDSETLANFTGQGNDHSNNRSKIKISLFYSW
jgi:solute carrier family 6 amino acid transporter-like protein 5/7/9/14